MTRTATEIASLTPSNAWDIYVGSDDPRDYSDEDITDYVNGSPMCADLDDDARDALAKKLADHAAGQR